MPCPACKDCAVFGIPDAEFGEALMAVVEPLPGATIDVADVRTHLKAHPRRLQGARSASRSRPICRARIPARSSSAACAIPYWERAGRRI